MGNEIKNNIACIRRKAGDKTGFAVPSDYFNNLEDTLRKFEVGANIMSVGGKYPV